MKTKYYSRFHGWPGDNPRMASSSIDTCYRAHCLDNAHRLVYRAVSQGYNWLRSCMHGASGALSCARSPLAVYVYLLPDSVCILCCHRQALQKVFLFNIARVECLSILKTSETILVS